MTRTRAALTGVGTYLPEARLTNELIFEHYGEWSAEKISNKTGIDSRHVAAEDEFTSDMAVKAAEALFAEDPSRREGIDMMMLTTVTPDYLVPFTAGMIHDALGLPKSVAAMDVGLGCSGYVYGLGIAAGMVESGRMRKVLLLTGDRFSTFTEQGGQDVRTLFGDGASASLIEAVDADGTTSGAFIEDVSYGTDGSGARKLLVPTSGVRGHAGNETCEESKPILHMDGPHVFDFTLRTVAPHIREFLEKRELSVPDVDLFVFHQANLFMMEHLRRRLKVTDEQFVVHIAEVGNTISSSIPIALRSAMDAGRVKPGSKVLLVGFGVGYSWGCVLLEYPG